MILTNPGQYLQRKIKKKIWVAVPFFYVKRVSHIKIAFAAFVVHRLAEIRHNSRF